MLVERCPREAQEETGAGFASGARALRDMDGRSARKQSRRCAVGSPLVIHTTRKSNREMR